MFSRRISMAALSAVLLSALSAAPAAAAKPTPSPAPPAGGVSEPPLSPEQRAASDRKIAAAQAYLAEASGADLVSLACVTPTSTGTASGTSTTAQSGVVTTACAVPQGFLAVEARDQIFGHYCGPAVGQVIANYSWAVGAGANKYTQRQLASWMGTDANGGTSSQALANGLEVATRNSPRRPAIWTWVVSPLSDLDRDGHTGDELQGYARSNISGSRMPLAFSLKPYDANGKYHLSSWRRPVVSVGHWIAAYGWVGNYSNSNELARIYYTDSSRDEGGGTGKYWDPTRHIAGMINVHTRVFVW